MSCCKAEIYKWCEDEDIIYKEDGKEYCIFHAPAGRKGESADEFNWLVFEIINKAIKKNKYCNLSGTIFEKDISFSRFNENTPFPPINFTSATFSGYTSFEGSSFSEEANFEGVTFNKWAFFKKAIFGEGANFSDTIFSGGTSFKKAIFIEGANFEKAIFGNDVTFDGEANFEEAIFGKRANFEKATFTSYAFFLSATFRSEANFRQSTFFGEAYFTSATFDGKTIFHRAIFNKNSAFSSANFSEEVYFFGYTFSDILFNELSIKDKIRFEEVDITKASFLNTDLRKIDFINCTWPKKYGRDVLYDELNLFSKIDDGFEKDRNFLQRLKQRFKGSFPEILKREWKGFKRDLSCNKEVINKVEILYRRLKQKYTDEHDQHEISNWHYGEKEMYRKGSRFRRLFLFSLSNLYWLSSGYGERAFRAGIVLFLLILSISVLFGISGLIPSSKGIDYGISEIKIEKWSDITNLCKFCFILLSTLQYATFGREPTFIPNTITGWYLHTAARIFIPLQAALFALAVRNRFRR